MLWMSCLPDVLFIEVRLSHTTSSGWKHLSGSSSCLLSYLIDELQLQPVNLGLDPTYDLLWHYHCLSAVHDYQLSAIELFQPPLLVPGTMCRLMSHPHHVCQFSVAAWRPTSSSVHSLDCCSPCELAKPPEGPPLPVFIPLTVAVPVNWLRSLLHHFNRSCYLLATIFYCIYYCAYYPLNFLQLSSFV